jgi:predicted P-loop ATPase
MPLAISSTKPSKTKSRQATTLTSAFGSVYSVDEINAYIAIRDELLAEAEELHTSAKLAATELANDFVFGCLKSARAPYEAQCLPESDAVRERKRCEIVRGRIAELRNGAA